ncbi:hypothetical protein EON67_04315, partial [archaeon]
MTRSHLAACMAAAAACTHLAQARCTHALSADLAWAAMRDVDAPLLSRYRALNNSFTPQQLHIAPTTDPSRLLITYITSSAVYTQGSVRIVPLASPELPQVFNTSQTTYDVGVLGGWTGFIHTAQITGLQPNAYYNYTAGFGLDWSDVRTFKTAPAPGADQSVYIAVTADQGTYVPFGFAVSKQMTADFEQEPFDLALLAGDVAYAGMQSQADGEWEPIWDIYGLQVEDYASRRPFVTTVGNHESYYNYTSFTHRYY